MAPQVSLEDMPVEQLLEYARGLESNSQLLQILVGHPDTREPLQRLIKRADPTRVIPEIDAADKLRKEQEPLLQKIQGLEQKQLERDVRDRINERRNSIKAKYRLTDDQVAEVENTIMTQSDSNPEPILSHDAAARVYLAQRMSAKPTPASFRPPTYDMPEKETWAPGIGNPTRLNQIALNEAFAAVNALERGEVPGLGAARGVSMRY